MPIAAPGPVTFDFDPGLGLRDAKTGHLALNTPLGSYELVLEPNPIALGAVWGLNGEPIGVVDQITTFKGETTTGTHVRVGFTPVGIMAVIFEDDPVQIDPALLSVPDAPLGQHLVHRWSQLAPLPGQSFEGDTIHVPGLEPTPTSAGPTSLAWKTAEFLIEADAAFYNLWSGVGNCDDCWIQAQQAVMNFASAVFEQQTSVEFRITSQWACTSVLECPYLGDNMHEWLGAFINRWEDRTNEPYHDLGHLMIGKQLADVNGVATLGSVATTGGYAASEVVPWSPPTAVPTGGVPSVHTVIHEIGHNFNGLHEEAHAIPVGSEAAAGGAVHTLMWFEATPARLAFSDGAQDSAYNNRDRIIALASAALD